MSSFFCLIDLCLSANHPTHIKSTRYSLIHKGLGGWPLIIDLRNNGERRLLVLFYTLFSIHKAITLYLIPIIIELPYLRNVKYPLNKILLRISRYVNTLFILRSILIFFKIIKISIFF